MAELVPTNGVVIHAERNWPCASCRPLSESQADRTFLCLECAIALTAASIQRIATDCAAELRERPAAPAIEAEDVMPTCQFAPPRRRNGGDG